MLHYFLQFFAHCVLLGELCSYIGELGQRGAFLIFGLVCSLYSTKRIIAARLQHDRVQKTIQQMYFGSLFSSCCCPLGTCILRVSYTTYQSQDCLSREGGWFESSSRLDSARIERFMARLSSTREIAGQRIQVAFHEGISYIFCYLKKNLLRRKYIKSGYNP